MADQDAQDINQMMSASSDIDIVKPKKAKFLWIVLGCVVVGVIMGVVVYRRSISQPPVVKTTPKPTSVAGLPSPVGSPVTPATNVVTQVANTMTFPKAGKLRVFSDINKVQLVITITTGGVTKTITLPSRTVDATTLMNSTDATFDVTAGSTGTVKSFLNSATGQQNLGWILPNNANQCGANGAVQVDIMPKIDWVTAHLATGETIFAKQCWADPGGATSDPATYDFNDFMLVWSYASSTTASPSPSGSAAASTVASPSPSANASVAASPSPSVAASPSPSSLSSSSSPSTAGTTVTTPTPSARVAMPDTSEGTPVTGIFEVTVGTVSVGLIFLVLGLFGLLAL